MRSSVAGVTIGDYDTILEKSYLWTTSPSNFYFHYDQAGSRSYASVDRTKDDSIVGCQIYFSTSDKRWDVSIGLSASDDRLDRLVAFANRLDAVLTGKARPGTAVASLNAERSGNKTAGLSTSSTTDTIRSHHVYAHPKSCYVEDGPKAVHTDGGPVYFDKLLKDLHKHIPNIPSGFDAGPSWGIRITAAQIGSIVWLTMTYTSIKNRLTVLSRAWTIPTQGWNRRSKAR